MEEERGAEDFPLELEAALRHERLLAEGRQDAFVFGGEARGDAEAVQAEIESVEEQIANPPESLRGALAPGASRRVYLDGYLQGLRDALQIIDNFKGREPA